ncbi:MAG: primosomal protein N' [Nitrospirae bacterium]|nr:primosomal protein N' [Nitrospirota bacterium]
MAERDQRFAEVVVPAKPDRVFHYEIPAALRVGVKPGVRVRVSFGRRMLDAYVVGVVDRADVEQVKPIAAVLDPEPILLPAVFALCRWISEYYLAPWGKVLANALPTGLKVSAEKRISLTASGLAVDPATVRGAGRRLLEALRTHERGIGLSQLAAAAGSLAGLSTLMERGWVEETQRASDPRLRRRAYVELIGPPSPAPRVARAPRQTAVLEALAARGQGAFVAELGPEAAGPCRALASRGLVRISQREVERDPYGAVVVDSTGPTLTPHQRKAVDVLNEAVRTRRFAPYLLWGVTGSGKTEVYLQALAAALAEGRSCLLLVPEIALTGQIVQRVRGRFGRQVAVLHSGLSDAERFEAWTRVRRGEARIALGTRSALFAPLRDLGVIIVDEEQDGSYKQEDGVRYHARDSAMVLGRQTDAVVVLGSATPSLESYANAMSGRYGLLHLPERVESRALPAIRVVDLRAEREQDALLSEALREGITARLSRGEQVLLLLNRRGYAPVVLCHDCGASSRCPQCSVGLTFHRGRGRLCCHYCGFAVRPTDRCEGCGSHRVALHGVGTEQVEERLRREWPTARVARMDRDTTRTRFAHDTLLDGMRRRETDILVGTQMIAKGHDLPNVTLVGIINADVGLSLPDFRATERIFQLLAQAAGRAGRGDLVGEVILQTRRPSHEAFLFAQQHDVAGFYERELARRRELGYPPFGRLVIILIAGADESRVMAAAQRLAEAVKDDLPSGVSLLGPAPAPLWRLKGRHRWQLILKGPRNAAVREATRALLARTKDLGLPSGVTLDANVDPHHVL